MSFLRYEDRRATDELEWGLTSPLERVGREIGRVAHYLIIMAMRHEDKRENGR